MSAVADLAVAVLLGAALATGILLVIARIPAWGSPTLVRRLAPYLRDIGDPRGLTPVTPIPHGVRDRVDHLVSRMGGAELIAARLTQSGSGLSVAAFRARQLGWSVGGLLVGGVAAIAVAVASSSGAATLLVPPICSLGAAAVYDADLTRRARRRRARIEDELPTVLEFLALCLAAGEGLRDALRRVGSIGTGELTAELQRAVVESGTGASLADALGAVARRVDVPALARAVDHLVAAIDRGAPLAQVLQDQAVDARDEGKRVLIELAGRKEIAMLLPLVFLLLPLSVMFAVFPGIVMLRLGAG